MFINPYLLSEPRLYDYLCQQLPNLASGRYSESDISEIYNNLKKIAYAGWHSPNYYLTDQVFISHWQHLLKRINESGSITLALLGQVRRFYLDEDKRHVAVKLSHFDAWQGWIANQSALPVVANKVFIMSKPSSLLERYIWLKELLGYNSVISPYHRFVEDYIYREGLYESHMHINGTICFDVVWHNSLLEPEKIHKDLMEKYSSDERVPLLYASNPCLDHPDHFLKLLKIARIVRLLLITWVYGTEEKMFQCKAHVQEITSNFRYFDEKKVDFSLEQQFFENTKYQHHIAEVLLHVSIQEKLNEKKYDYFFDFCYLFYVLSMNCAQYIFVQRTDQFGFDQFQKYANDGVRESFEMDYSAMFYQLHGKNHQNIADISILEGRFAPKNTHIKNIKLITNILRGFLIYKGEDSLTLASADLNSLAELVSKYERPKLLLVGHFIKTKWNHAEESHFYSLRKVLNNNSQLLFELIEQFPKLKNIITGIDVAANEIDAPPEVFATLYRNCRRKNFRYFTYHVGEDFEHLLSGIRSIFDAITLLGLANGDRIGHGTAIGINPKLWLDNMPSKIFLTKGHWLEDLLFLRHIILTIPGFGFPLDRLEAEIAKLASKIFKQEQPIPLYILQEFFNYRGLNPDVINSHLTLGSPNFTDWQNDEFKLVKTVAEIDNKILLLLHSRWSDQETIKRYQDEIEVSLNFISEEILIKTQQFVQKLIVDNNIVIETLPTSNVRISHYNSLKEHHLFRWLHVKQCSIEGDHKMLISMGTDDPGIFSTSLKNEFYHIFSILIYEYGYSAEEALNVVAKLNENGRIFAFLPNKFT